MSLRDLPNQIPLKPVPAGWKTTRELALDEDLTGRRVQILLRDGIEAGLWEKRTFRIKTINGPRLVPHYRPKPKR